MFRLGSRSKSPRRQSAQAAAAAMMYPPNGSANQGGVSSTGNPGSPTSILTGSGTSGSNSSSQGQDPLHLQRPFSPWDSTTEGGSSSPSGHHHHQKGGSSPASANSSTSSFFSHSTKSRPLSPTSSIRTSTTSASSSMTRSTRSLLSRAARKHQANNVEEFDPTTFRKNRSRPALGARGQDAIYHEYNDLFEEEDEDLDLDDDGEEGDEEEGEGEEELYDDSEHEQNQQQLNDENSGILLLQLDDKTILPPDNNNNRRKTTSAATDRRQQQPHLQHALSVSSKLRHRPAHLTPITISNPPHEPLVSITPPPPPTPPPKTASAYAWRKPIETDTPPRSTAPSVDELEAASAPILHAPPTPPPKPDSSSNNSGSFNIFPTPASRPPITRSQSHQAPTSAPQGGRRYFGERSSSMTIKQPRSIPEGLGVNIPSPTLFTSTSPGAWAADHAQQPALTAEGGIKGSGSPGTMLFDELDSNNTTKLKSSSSRSDLHSDDGKTIKASLPSDDDREPPSRSASRSVSRAGSVHLRSRASSSASAAGSSSGGGLKSRRSKNNLVAADGEENSVREAADEDGDEEEAATAPASTNHSRNASAYSLSEKESGSSTPGVAMDPAYLRAFRQFVRASAENDAFVSRGPRFDAIQAHRICSRLRDEYPLQVTAPKKERRPSDAPNSKARLREAGEEIMTSLWALMAARWMNHGKIIISPANETLVAHCAKQLNKRATVRFDGRAMQMLAQAGAGGKPFVCEDQERRRVLDLGGMPVADWGWHCAVDYPKVKVYTVTQRPRMPLTPQSAATPNFRGPKNHRHLSVDRLYRLPFPDNHFDVVSTRTLFLILPADEYDRVLEECLRVLKPGGYFEWQLFDAEVINAGPQADALAAKFDVALKTIGRDPEPTKRWIPRIHAAGFEECRRAWMMFPLAPPVSKPAVPAKDDDVAEQVRRKMQTWEEDGGVVGTTKDVAPVAGLLGGWVWEKWLRAAGIEEEGAVGAVVEEAKEWGSALRSLVGYARKPMV